MAQKSSASSGFKLSQKSANFGLKLTQFVALAVLILQFPKSTLADYMGVSTAEITATLVRIHVERFQNIAPLTQAIIDCAAIGTCLQLQRNLLGNQVLLERQYRTVGQPCWNSEFDLLLLQPPNGIGHPDFPAYIEWQFRLLAAQQTFCHPIQNLQCGATSFICQCHPLLFWSAALGRCTVPLTRSCSFNYDTAVYPPGRGPPAYYDPLSPLNSIQIEFTHPLFCSFPKCERPSYFIEPDSFCFDEALVAQSDARRRYFLSVSDSKFGESCDQGDQNRLYTERGLAFGPRTVALTTLQSGGRHFCDLRQFLTCGNSKVCECMAPAIFDQATQKCTLPPPWNECGKYQEITSITGNISIAFEAREDFGVAFEGQVASCDVQQECFVDDDHDNGLMEMYCNCRPGTTGRNCQAELTKFFTRVRRSMYPSDVPGQVEKDRIFLEFNKVLVEFETIFKLASGAPCSPNSEIKVRRIVRIIQSFEARSAVNPKEKFDETVKLIKDEMGATASATAAAGNLKVCDRTQGLICKLIAVGNLQQQHGICERNVSFGAQAEILLNGIVTLACGATCDHPDWNPWSLQQYEATADGAEERYAFLEETAVGLRASTFCDRESTCIVSNRTVVRRPTCWCLRDGLGFGEGDNGIEGLGGGGALNGGGVDVGRTRVDALVVGVVVWILIGGFFMNN